MNHIMKNALQYNLLHVSGIISERCVLKVWSDSLITLTARKQQIIGIGLNFCSSCFCFFGQMGQVASSNLATPKSTGHCCVCVHVIHQKGLSTCSPFCLKDDLWTAAWHHQTNTTVYIIRRVYYPHMYLCVMHTYDYSYIYIYVHIYIYAPDVLSK